MSHFLSPLWLIVLPLVTALLTFVIRRRERSACLLAALLMLVTVRLCLSLPFDWSVEFLGRSISLHPSGRTLLAGLFFLAAMYLGYSSLRPQGRAFSYLIPIVLGLLAAVVMVESSEVAVLLLEIALILVVLGIQTDSLRSVRGALYYLMAMVMAAPLLLIMVHLTQIRVLNPIDSTLPRTAAVLLVFGVMALLGAAPFQAWLYTVCLEASPLIVGFISSVVHGVILFKLLGWLQEFPWLVQDGRVLPLLSTVGVISVILGALLLFWQRELRAAFAGLILFDTGYLFIGLSALLVEGPAPVALLWINRAIAVTLVGMGMTMLPRSQMERSFPGLNGLIWRRPFSALALAVGGLSLAGFPLTAGFTARWMTVQSLPAETQKWVTILAMASAAACIGYLKWVAATAGKPSDDMIEGDHALFQAVIALLVAANIFLTLYPQVTLELLIKVMQAG